MAASYLTGRAANVTVEVDRVAGYDMPQATRDHVLKIIRRESAASGGATMLDSDVLAPRGGMPGGGGDDRYSIEELRELTRSARNQPSTPAAPVMHFVILDGRFYFSEAVLGIALNASTIVIFAEQVEAAADLVVGAASIWRAVSVHEMGHLWSLVELTGRSKTSRHADPDHPGHSPSQESVMYWAIEHASITEVLTGGPPDDFDRFDREDLAEIRNS